MYFLIMSYGIRVRLATDLTSYDARLTVGQEGVTTRPGGSWSRGSDRFVSVRFDCGAYQDILWQSLDIIDKEHLARMAESRRQRDEAAAKATNVVLSLGPNGGFRTLSYKQPDGSGYNTGSRDEADQLMAIMRANGVRIREEREPRGGYIPDWRK